METIIFGKSCGDCQTLFDLLKSNSVIQGKSIQQGDKLMFMTEGGMTPLLGPSRHVNRIGLDASIKAEVKSHAPTPRLKIQHCRFKEKGRCTSELNVKKPLKCIWSHK